ncbi:unnamed protein product [Polarella glacialis]|uniref:EF-hand domain-containing protein n=1 Tax=Polarella glacialis TaxID=89957 RepID=A0A813JR46_POLGL|nr:unnamed protein product [Polarella glacialis]
MPPGGGVGITSINRQTSLPELIAEVCKRKADGMPSLGKCSMVEPHIVKARDAAQRKARPNIFFDSQSHIDKARNLSLTDPSFNASLKPSMSHGSVGQGCHLVPVQNLQEDSGYSCLSQMPGIRPRSCNGITSASSKRTVWIFHSFIFFGSRRAVLRKRHGSKDCLKSPLQRNHVPCTSMHPAISMMNLPSGHPFFLKHVEQELAQWQCGKYTHITRAVHITDGKVIDLQTIFSRPSQDCPVPVAVVFVYFHLDTSTNRLSYQFEEENVQHEVGGQGLAAGMFERWLDRIIGDKLQVRQLHNLATPFEVTRLVPPPTHTEDVAAAAVEAQAAEESLFTRQESIKSGKEKAQEDKLDLSTLLANIFDAADEEDEFELTHKEVADLLYATPLGLTDWDIKLLLTTATEFETSRIEYKPFVQAAPEIIEALLKRRAAFEERLLANPLGESQVTLEAIELCYGEEIEEVGKATREAFAQVDHAGTGTLSRHEFRSCLMARIERLSLQEVQMLMQMCKEDDLGQVLYEDFPILLQQLRIDALHNALVETDVSMLRTHLILLARRMGLPPDNIMPVWDLRSVLLSADQLCLSRMQIHVILSIVHPDEHGEVDMGYFLQVCCTVIPQMFDTAAFAEKAATIAKEKADQLAKAELEELQGITSSLANKNRRADDEDQEDTQANAPDRDAVEKNLIHVGNQADEKHRQQPTLEVRRFLEAMHHESVAACQLSEAELRGFVAEAEIDALGEVAYVEHIKTWVPILFELRKSRIYDSILAKEWGPGEEQLVNLSSYEAQFPLSLSTEHGDGEDNGRPGSAASSVSRRKTGNARRSGSKQLDQGDEGRPGSRSGKPRRTSNPGSAKRNLSSRSLTRSDSLSSQGSERSSRRGSRAPSRTG